MFIRPNFFQIAFTLLGAAATVLVFIVAARPPSEDDWRAAIETAVRSAMPASSDSCGYIRIGQDRSTAQRCMSASERDGRSWWSASEAQGEDSRAWVVVYRRNDSSIVELHFDSYGWEHRGSKPSFTSVEAKTCKRLHLGAKLANGDYEYHEPAFTCEL